jgi:hypothetical protein
MVHSTCAEAAIALMAWESCFHRSSSLIARVLRLVTATMAPPSPGQESRCRRSPSGARRGPPPFGGGENPLHEHSRPCRLCGACSCLCRFAWQGHTAIRHCIRCRTSPPAGCCGRACPRACGTATLIGRADDRRAERPGHSAHGANRRDGSVPRIACSVPCTGHWGSWRLLPLPWQGWAFIRRAPFTTET